MASGLKDNMAHWANALANPKRCVKYWKFGTRVKRREQFRNKRQVITTLTKIKREKKICQTNEKWRGWCTSSTIHKCVYYSTERPSRRGPTHPSLHTVVCTIRNSCATVFRFFCFVGLYSFPVTQREKTTRPKNSNNEEKPKKKKGKRILLAIDYN
jgi:hypothetical protein